MNTVVSAFEDYRVDDLILLVGGNPLPNYVAARLLAQAGSRVWLICSPKTRSVAYALADALNLPAENDNVAGKFVIHAENIIEVDERNPASITEGICKAKVSGMVGLNYTGGNKTMSVQAYRKIEKDFPNASFSYLDPSSLKLCIHDAGGFNSQWLDTKDVFVLPLDRLMQMHRLKRQPGHSPQMEPRHVKLAVAITNLNAAQEGQKKWVVEIRKKGWQTLPPEDGELQEIYAAWREMCDGNDPTADGVAKAMGHEKLDSCVGYFKGKWLEDYALDRVRKATHERNDCADVQAGLKLLRNDQSHKDFDMDIVFMRGYQLFALSCMAEHVRGKNKEHLMEIYVRARQLGGDEARAGLVCLSDEPADLQKEVENSWEAEGKIKVFGRKHLKQLEEHIGNWLDEQGKEKK